MIFPFTRAVPMMTYLEAFDSVEHWLETNPISQQTLCTWYALVKADIYPTAMPACVDPENEAALQAFKDVVSRRFNQLYTTVWGD